MLGIRDAGKAEAETCRLTETREGDKGMMIGVFWADW